MQDHNRPSIMFSRLFTNPIITNPNAPPEQISQAFDDLYEDLHEELSKYGEIEELNMVDNLCEHLIGNVYLKYSDEESAERALKALIGRFYGGSPIVGEYSPVTDFREASCRD